MERVRIGMTWVVLLAAGVLSGCTQEVKRPARIDPRADEALRRMSAALSGSRSFSVRSTTTVDELLPSGQLGEFSRETTVTLRRPDRLLAEIQRGDDAWLLWHSDNDLTVLDRKVNTWATVKVPASNDDMLDDLARKHGLTMPLADLLFTDPYKVLTAEARTGSFVGTSQLNGVECSQLLFTQDNVDWQIWIATDKTALPRKIVIDYKNQPGRPQFTAVLRDWNLSAEAGDHQFKPALPKDVRKIEFAQMLQDSESRK